MSTHEGILAVSHPVLRRWAQGRHSSNECKRALFLHCLSAGPAIDHAREQRWLDWLASASDETLWAAIEEIFAEQRRRNLARESAPPQSPPRSEEGKE